MDHETEFEAQFGQLLRDGLARAVPQVGSISSARLVGRKGLLVEARGSLRPQELPAWAGSSAPAQRTPAPAMSRLSRRL
jgi:hypothetical protein